MGRITAIEAQKKTPTRVNIFLDGQFAFGISAESAYLNKLKTGGELTEAQVKKLIQADQVERLTEKIVRFLGYRPRSEREVKDHLTYKGKLKDLKTEEEKAAYLKSIEGAIHRVKKLGYLDDTEFAQWWVEQRETFRKTSRRLLQAELLHKGIERETIAQILEKGSDEQAKATVLAEKRLKLVNKLPEKEKRIKLGQYLARRGFDWEIIKKVVDTLLSKAVE